MESAIDWHTARTLLEWQVELGVDEAIAAAPVDRFAVEAELKKKAAAARAAQAQGQQAQQRVAEPVIDPIADASKAANAAADLPALQQAIADYPHCPLRRGARNLVFADGIAGSKVMFIGEAPGRDEDLQGKPFVGRAGHLLDKMLSSIGLSRDENAYITNVLPWRPPQNREPKPEEIAMMLPFLKRHITLAKPALIVIVGNISCQALLGRRGITRLRGQWTEVDGIPALPMLHPAYLLRTPSAKRETWADLLEIRAKLETLS